LKSSGAQTTNNNSCGDSSCFSWSNNSKNGTKQQTSTSETKNVKTDDNSSAPQQLPGSFFCFTSNVDAHFRTAGYPFHELCELHGNVETWQCSKPCKPVTWQAPKDYRFKVDATTLKTVKDESAPPGFGQEPRCLSCNELARPAVLMFCDSKCVEDKAQKRLSKDWLTACQDVLRSDPKKRLVLLEIGCGWNVPYVRSKSESVLEQISEMGKGQATLIRINLDFPLPKKLHEYTIPLMSGGLNALKKIDIHLQKRLASLNKAARQQAT
jgi:NAD-dependent SIR2 family protein deacetylase